MVTFHSNRDGTYAGHSIRLDGSARTQLTDFALGNVARPVLRPGGDLLAAYVEHGGWVLADPPWPATEDTVRPVPKVTLPTGELSFAFRTILAWSSDGRRVVGEVDDSSGAEAGVAVLDVASGAGELLTAESVISDVRWLPDDERVLFFASSDELVVLDVETKERRSIPVQLPYPLAERSFALAPDGTAIYFGAERIESSVWIVERDS